MIVLDTGTWIWWVADPGRLSRTALKCVEREERRDGLVLSAISAWEVALKHSLGKLELDRDVRTWISRAAAYPGLRVEPLGQDDAIESAHLPGDLHRDPADRFIIALARRLRAPIVTADRLIRSYAHVETVW